MRLYGYWVRLRDKLFSVAVSGAFESFGKRSVISVPVRLSGVHRISIGSGVGLGPGCWLQTLDPPGGGRPRLAIGDGVVSSGGTVLSAAREVVVERGVLFARNVYVGDHIHEYRDAGVAVQLQPLAKLAPIRIGEGAWLGQNVVVCPGVTIGRGSVIGANSVVTVSVPEFSLAVGAPARVVRTFGHGSDSRIAGD